MRFTYKFQIAILILSLVSQYCTIIYQMFFQCTQLYWCFEE